MPVTPTYPGVYIEEIPSGVRTITGVSTAVAAFVGYTSKGPVNKAKKIFDFGAFEREFGGLSKDSEIGYAVKQFFLNGGAEAWVVRLATGAVKAAITLKNFSGDNSYKTLVVTATSEGIWGNYLKLDVDYNTANPDSTFNLIVSEYKPGGTNLVLGRVETFRNLSMDQQSAQYAPKVINASSQLVEVARHKDVTDARLSELPAGWSLSGDLSVLTLPGGLDDTRRFISLIVDGDGPYEIPIFPSGSTPVDLSALATSIQNAIRNINPGLDRFSKFTVQRTDALGMPNESGNFLLFTAGTPATTEREWSSVRILNASKTSATQALKLGLSNKGREGEAASALRPCQNGTVSGDLSDLDITTLRPSDQVSINIPDGITTIASGTFTLGSSVSSLAALAAELQKVIRQISSHKVFSRVVVQLVGTQLRVVLSGTENTDATIRFDDASGGKLAENIRLLGDHAEENVQRYSIGVGAVRASQVDPVPGNDGTPPNASLLRGLRDNKSGIYALEDVDIFNILCIPRLSELDETSALAVMAEAASYCAARRAFLIIDPPKDYRDVDKIRDWATAKITPDKNAALYFPFVLLADPLDDFRLNAFPPSGTVAGLYARIDSTRGVWKAPAGTEATLSNVQGLAYTLTDMENGELNKVGVNCLRQFPVHGRVSWGARTLEGSDQRTSDWKYIPVRRLALFIEESLYRSTQWVVFEPNDEPLWAQIRLNVGAFMHNLFRQGAFKGQTPREAYFVKCDKETTIQNDINLGIVNILVGFAPLKPAEFVIITIQQMAGQIQT